MHSCDIKTMMYHFLNLVVTSKLSYIVFEDGWETVFYHSYTVKVYYNCYFGTSSVVHTSRRRISFLGTMQEEFVSFDSELLHSVKERHQRMLTKRWEKESSANLDDLKMSSSSSSDESSPWDHEIRTKETDYQDSSDDDTSLNASCAEKIPQVVSLE